MKQIEEVLEEKLCEIERKERVKILYAVESGSRAWGVASPDSDYDVRFIYVRSIEDYLRLNSLKDVIEWQMDDVLDINGWDLRKALQQFHRGNAALFEWGRSPIVYKTTPEWDNIYKTAKEWFSEKAALYHYYATAKNTYLQHLLEEQVRYKKYIYALRPILACGYIEKNHRIPPVLFHELAEYCLPESLKPELGQMLEIKKQSGERERHPQIPKIQNYIQEELKRLEVYVKSIPDDRNKDWMGLNKLFWITLNLDILH